MNERYTPGPWAIDHSHPGTDRHQTIVATGNFSTGLTYEQIAVCKGRRHRDHARLIAAAPELLEALRWLCDAADTEPGMSIYKAHMAEARASIAKATQS